MAIAFANQIFMGKDETEILSQSAFKPLVYKEKYISRNNLIDSNF